jgi:ATP-dependent DNA ligase
MRAAKCCRSRAGEIACRSSQGSRARSSAPRTPSPSASPVASSRPASISAKHGLFDLPPTRIAPAIPTLVREAPRGPNWLHEVKHDSYRVVCVVDQGAVSIYTRRGHNWADRMPSIARALSALKVRSAVIDGEAIVVGEDGLSDFFTLHAALARKNAPRAVLVAFDIMHLDGEDNHAAPSHELRLGTP